MSDQTKPEEKKESQGATTDKKTDNAKAEEDDEGYSCKSCWYGYCACIVWCCKVFILMIKLVCI